MITSIDDDELTEELKGFIGELVAIVDSTSFRRASLSESDIVVPQKDFSTKFKEYEGQITKLSLALEEHSKKTSYFETKCEGYASENGRLKDEIARLTIFLSEAKDEYFQQMREKELHLKASFQNERSELEELIAILKSQKNELAESNVEIKDQIELAQIKIKDQAQVINRIAEDYVPKKVHDILLSEKHELDKKLLQLENSLITESSQCETYKQQMAKLRATIEEGNQEKAALRNEIEEMHVKLKEQIVIHKEHIDRSELRGNQDQINFSYKFPQVDESTLNALAFNTGHNDLNQELMIKFEQLQNKFEEHRLQSQKETETLKKSNRDLQNELFSVKSQFQQMSDGRDLRNQRSTRDISSKDFSSIKKSNEISDELIEKAVRMEQQNKKLKTDLRVLNQMTTSSTEANYQQLCILYSASLAYADLD